MVAFKKLGEIGMAQKEFKVAKKNFLELLKINQTDSDVWQRLGIILYRHFG